MRVPKYIEIEKHTEMLSIRFIFIFLLLHYKQTIYVSCVHCYENHYYNNSLLTLLLEWPVAYCKLHYIT